jgi:hypothetical protein
MYQGLTFRVYAEKNPSLYVILHYHIQQ